MANTEKMTQKAIERVDASLSGERYSKLVKEISTDFSEIPKNTIHGSLHKFHIEFPAEIVQPSRGLYQAIRFRAQRQELQAEFTKKLEEKKIREEDILRSLWRLADQSA